MIQTLLNNCHGMAYFKYIKTQLDSVAKRIDIWIKGKKSAKVRCSSCQGKAPIYDHQKERVFQFVPLWGYRCYLHYRPRRVSCKRCGIVIEWMPWAIGKRPVCKAFALFLSEWAKRLSWTDTATLFKTSWDIVYRSVSYVVDYGLRHRQLEGITAIGIDEILFRRGRKFVTLVFEITEGSKRLLWIGEDRKAKTLLRFFRLLGKEWYKNIQIVCSDMWKPYLKVVKKKLPNALHILDRFHIMKAFNKAIDAVRRGEFNALKETGDKNVLTSTRWLFLKNPENLTALQSIKLKELIDQNLKTYKAYLMKECFQKLWTLSTPRYARIFIGAWCKMALRSQVDPLKKIAKMLQRHLPYLLNWFKTEPKISNGVVEGFNNKVKVIMRRACRFLNFDR